MTTRDSVAKKVRLAKLDRAWSYAVRVFKLELYVENGKRFVISERFQGSLRGFIALAWLAGYRAGRSKK